MSYIGNQPTSVAFLTDQFSGNGSTTAFTMSVAPATTSSILVAITGVVQDPSTYAVSGTTLTFSAAPPTGTGNISVRYLGIPASGVATTAYRTLTEFTATAGQTSFSVPSYTAGFINVYQNGVMLGSADYTATTGTTVVLASGATAGDLITTESFYVSSVLNAIPATAGAVNSTYITDSAVTTAKIADANVTQAKLDTSVIPIGTGQTWTDVTASRDFSTTYTNSTGRPIMLSIRVGRGASTASQGTVTLTVDGSIIARYSVTESSSTAWNNITQTASIIIPSGSTYALTHTNGAIASWFELR